VEYYAPFLSNGGYASEARGFAMGLFPFTAHEEGDGEQDAALDLTCMQHGDSIDNAMWGGMVKEDRQRLGKLMLRTQQTQALDVVICHSEPGAWTPARYNTAPCPGTYEGPRRARVIVGRTMFETDRLPAGWAGKNLCVCVCAIHMFLYIYTRSHMYKPIHTCIHTERLNKMDFVWVPTEFSRRVFEAGGVSAAKLMVVGESVDTAFFSRTRVRASGDTLTPADLFSMGSGVVYGTRPDPAAHTQNPFVFLSVFKWEERKNWKCLVRAFALEFKRVRDSSEEVTGGRTDEPPALLVLKVRESVVCV
jgi:glycosyltransferase involved in cell wall biosynthesis